MEPLAIAFKALKITLNEITISPGKINVDYNDFIDFGDPVAQRAWDTQYKEPEFVEIDDYVINHKNYHSVDIGAFKTEFENVRAEFAENVKVLGINNILDYLDGVIKYYTNLEARIIENEDGSFSSDMVIFEECDAVQVNNSLFKNSYNDFLVGLKRALRDEIVFFSKQKILNSPLTPDKNKLVSARSQKQQYKSLSLLIGNKSKFDEVLREFHKALKDYGYIETIDYRLFKRAFVNEEIVEKINWLGDSKDLYYLIKSLHTKQLIKPFIGFWPLTIRCFVLKNGTERVLTSDYLARCDDPKQYNRMILDSIVDTLII